MFSDDILSDLQITTYAILNKDDDYLAIPALDVQLNSPCSLALFEQGYILLDTFDADNPNTAVKNFKLLFRNEIRMLKEEIIKLKGEILELTIINNKLKKNAAGNASDSIKLYELFGFNAIPNTKELKVRYKRIQGIVHSDKGGDDKLSQVFNNAYEVLKKISEGHIQAS